MLKPAITVIALAIAAPAYADDFSFNFKYHELETAGAAEALFKRLESRVEGYCMSSGRKPLTQRAIEEECVEDVLTKAVAQINDPRLNRIFARKSGAADFAGSSSDG